MRIRSWTLILIFSTLAVGTVSCGGSKSSETEKSAALEDIDDTLAHGIRQELKGVVLDSITINKDKLEYSDPIPLRTNLTKAGVPDTIVIDSSYVYNQMHPDSIQEPKLLEVEKRITALAYPSSYKISRPLSRDVSTFDIHYLSKENGLPTSAISDLVLDNESNLWIGLYGKGFMRYDGNEVLHFTKEHGLIDNNVQQVYADSKGRIWICTNVGLSCFDGQKFESFIFEFENGRGRITDVIEGSDGTMWAASWGGGLIKITKDGQCFQYWKDQGLNAEIIYCLSMDSDGVLWMGLRNEGLGILRNGRVEHYKGERLSKSVRSIALADDGAWLGTEFGVLFFGEGQMLDYQDAPVLGKSLVWEVSLDRYGRLWTATYRQGISCFDGENVQFFDQSAGINGSTAREIVEDRHGSLWISTDDGGLNIVNPDGFEYLKETPGIDLIDVRDIDTDGEHVWISSFGKGVLRYRNDSIDVVKGDLDKLMDHFYKDSRDTFWMAGFYTLHKMINDTLFTYSMAVDDEHVSVQIIEEDANGVLWMGRKKGLLQYDNGTFTYLSAATGFTDAAVRSIIRDGDEMWIGTDGSGLYHYDGQAYLRYSKAEGLLNEDILCLYKSGSALWIGTNGGGMFRFEDGSFTRYGKEDGLSDNYVKDFHEDQQGRIWITTENGLTVMDGDQLIPNTQQSGMNMGDFQRNGSFLTDDGVLWCGSRTGITRINTNNYQKDTVVPNIQLNDVLLKHRSVNYRKLKTAIAKDEAFYLSDTDIDLREVQYDSIAQFKNRPIGLVLPHYINELSFDFSVTDINGAQRYEYSYLLEGSESDWSPFTEEKTANFTNLPSGDYILKIKARNQYGILSDEYSYPFTILTPWWRTGLAYVSYVILFLLGFYLFFRIRTATFRARQRVLEHTVAERTHELKLQKEEVELKNLEISDSINYAKRIQEAILPANKYFAEHLKDGFILYQPKDIVAGDFYWMDVIETEAEPIILFAVADCTGHGVPGAMVSVVCNEALNRSVKEFHLTSPADILDQTRKLVVNSFAKSDKEVKDGMDIALCALQGDTIHFSGANNPLWVLRAGEIIEIKGDKQPIGRFEREFPFNVHEFKLQPNDCIYLFSDGFADQFGGDTEEKRRNGGKKFKYKNFKKLLIETSSDEMEDQKAKIVQSFTNWKGDLEQLDDVCVLGVRI